MFGIVLKGIGGVGGVVGGLVGGWLVVGWWLFWLFFLGGGGGAKITINIPRPKLPKICCGGREMTIKIFITKTVSGVIYESLLGQSLGRLLARMLCPSDCPWSYSPETRNRG